MSRQTRSGRGRALRNPVLFLGVLALSACAEGQMPGFLQPKGGEETVTRAATNGGSRSVERDIEAPEVFEATESGLWDGRPSLGGVWVAHPDVPEPERVIIRNEANGKFVVGALFRRERLSPGPRLQVSSDAAAALGMLAGAPNMLNVVALKRADVAAEPETLPAPDAEPMANAIPAAPGVTGEALGPADPVLTGAASVLETASLTPWPRPRPLQARRRSRRPRPSWPQPRPPAATGKLSRPFVQIGIFSVQENADNTATAMRQAGMVPTVKEHSLNGKTFWRVVVGPATTSAEMQTLLEKIKGTGFADAYAVDS